MAAKTEAQKDKADVHKKRMIAVQEMKHREKQARVWKKIMLHVQDC